MAATAVRVFGTPITHGTRAQRALAAKNNQNAGGKLDQVLLLSNQSQKAAVGGGNVSIFSTTYGKVYNATGETMTYVTDHDWEGNVSGKYPLSIQNGQWAAFQHVGTRRPGRNGSVAAVVYNFGDTCDSMISWNNPVKTAHGSNTVYCEMNDPGHFDHCDWNAIYKKLMESSTEDQTSMAGYTTKVSINNSNTACFTAKFHLDV